MKTTNAQIINRKAGMTLLELTVVILVLLSLIAILFVGARAWKKGSDRAANIMNIRNCQQAMRGHENMKELDAGDPFDQTLLEGYMKFPRDIAAAAIVYIPGEEIQERSADVATDGNHLWLTSGLSADDADYGFKSFAETSGW